jgi:hypothetical protein
MPELFPRIQRLAGVSIHSNAAAEAIITTARYSTIPSKSC